MSTNGRKPIFIHSLFRSGSTYLFDVFRRANQGYWCYQEPENEIFLGFADDPSSLIKMTDSQNDVLRHPKLDKPYLAEFVPVAKEIRTYFRKEFPYDSFFLPEQADFPELSQYLGMLIEHAQGRPVLQFCRSTGRIKWMKKHMDAIHLFLWREPWSQWWSYKVLPYFDTANLMILNADPLPPMFQEIRNSVGLDEFHSHDLGDEAAHFAARSLNSEQSYLVFYALWLHAMHEGLAAADTVLGVDRLSSSPDCRRQAIADLENLGVTRVDFSDCSIHRCWFGEQDTIFFRAIEQQVHDIFLRHGYTEETLRIIAGMHEQTQALQTAPGSMEDSRATQEDLERSRQLIRRLESDVSNLKKEIIGLRSLIAKLEISRAQLQSIYDSLPWKAAAPLLHAYWKIRSLYRSLKRKNREPSSPGQAETVTAASDAGVPRPCPVCLDWVVTEYTRQGWLIDGQRYKLVKCRSCGSICTTPRPTAKALEQLYRTSFDYCWYQDHYDAKLRDCRMRVKEYGPLLGRRVLDFGGGMGYFSQAVAEAGLEGVTYDPYTNAAPPGEGQWDCVVSLHALEHSNDPDRTISLIKRFLAPGGRVIIAVPNAAGLGYKELGMRWVWAQPPLIHIFHFTARGLAALLSRHGFTEIQVSYHERWDANLYCDLEHAAQFRKWDMAWGLQPFNRLQPYRRLIARINHHRRFRGLKSAQSSARPNAADYSELQITARLKT